jgi:uncharacterized membrane protein
MPLVQNGRSYVPNRMNGTENISIDTQIQSIREDPGRYAQVLGATVADHGLMWVDQLGHLGWQDTQMNRLPLYLYLLVLVLVALGDEAAGLPPPLRVRIVAAALSAIGLVLIVTACYIGGSTPDCKLIYGPQGRYFLPLVPLVLLALSNRAFHVQADARLRLSLAGASATGVLLVGVVTLVRRYYITTDLELHIGPTALAFALVLVAGVVCWAATRWGAESSRPEPKTL